MHGLRYLVIRKQTIRTHDARAPRFKQTSRAHGPTVHHGAWDLGHPVPHVQARDARIAFLTNLRKRKEERQVQYRYGIVIKCNIKYHIEYLLSLGGIRALQHRSSRLGYICRCIHDMRSLRDVKVGQEAIGALDAKWRILR